jgi:hypothetical protein
MLTKNRYDFPYFYSADRWTQREENETVELVQGLERKSTNKPDSRGSKEYVYISKSKSSLRNMIRKSRITRTLAPTGTSIIPTRALALRSPIIKSTMIKAKKRTISTATEAGKPTELKPISELTPKHARRINRIPIGTYSHAVRFLCHVRRVT